MGLLISIIRESIVPLITKKLNVNKFSNYDNLKSYFYVFSIWIDNKCLSWDETIEYAGILGLEVVPVIYDGVYDKDNIIDAFKPHESTNEGYVVRLADEFTYGEFRRSLGKFVRPEFRQIVNSSHRHWISKKIEKNGLTNVK